jgi:hypothetical protein
VVSDLAHPGETPLVGGRFAGPVRRGAVVLRPATAASANIAALLRHLEEGGFEQAPRHLGVAADGRDRLTFVEGEAALPPYAEAVRTDEALIDVASTIRRFHDAAQSFVAPEPWTPLILSAAGPTETNCIGHGDLTPWNMVFRGPTVAAIIDWDTAGPSSRAWDLSYAAYQFVPLHPPTTLRFWGWDSQPDQRGRLARFVDAYGDPAITAAELLDLMVIRLTGFAAHMEHQIRLGDPAFDVHRDEQHARGSRSSASYLIENRDELVTG